MKLEIYTDGACSGNQFDNAKGGWGYAVIENNEVCWEKSGNAKDTTNNRMELTAVEEAFGFIHDLIEGMNISKYEKIVVYSDSAYVVNCFNQKWYNKWIKNGWKNSKKQPVKNQDLWKSILGIYVRIPKNVIFKHVKGHDGNRWNEYVDALAVKKMNEL